MLTMKTTFALLSLLTLALVGACAADDGAPVPGSAVIIDENGQRSPASEAELAPDPAHPADEAVSRLAAAKANCVTVQYCNAPGAYGSTCIWHDTRSGCGDFDAAVAECYSDVRYVCGGITYPLVMK